MTSKERIEACKMAIRSVQIKAAKAAADGRVMTYGQCMEELGALQACLYSEIDRASAPSTTEQHAENLLEAVEETSAQLEIVRDKLTGLLKQVKRATRISKAA